MYRELFLKSALILQLRHKTRRWIMDIYIQNNSELCDGEFIYQKTQV